MKTCATCGFNHRTNLTDVWENVPTCLHPQSRTPYGRPLSCNQAREGNRFCGPDGVAWRPVHVFAASSGARQ